MKRLLLALFLLPLVAIAQPHNGSYPGNGGNAASLGGVPASAYANPTCYSNSVYVASWGNDTNPGTSVQQPVADLNSAYSIAAAEFPGGANIVCDAMDVNQILATNPIEQTIPVNLLVPTGTTVNFGGNYWTPSANLAVSGGGIIIGMQAEYLFELQNEIPTTNIWNNITLIGQTVIGNPCCAGSTNIIANCTLIGTNTTLNMRGSSTSIFNGWHVYNSLIYSLGGTTCRCVDQHGIGTFARFDNDVLIANSTNTMTPLTFNATADEVGIETEDAPAFTEIHNCQIFASGNTNAFAVVAYQGTAGNVLYGGLLSASTTSGASAAYDVYAQANATNVLDGVAGPVSVTNDTGGFNFVLAGTNEIIAPNGNVSAVIETNGVVAGAIAEGDELIVNTNFQSGVIYSNSYGSVIEISSGATLTGAAVAGIAAMSIRVPGSVTNTVSLATLLTSLVSTNSVALPVTYVPAGSQWIFTNASTGTGNQATLINGQILAP